MTCYHQAKWGHTDLQAPLCSHAAFEDCSTSVRAHSKSKCKKKNPIANANQLLCKVGSKVQRLQKAAALPQGYHRGKRCAEVLLCTGSLCNKEMASSPRPFPNLKSHFVSVFNAEYSPREYLKTRTVSCKYRRLVSRQMTTPHFFVNVKFKMKQNVTELLQGSSGTFAKASYPAVSPYTFLR